MKVNYLIDSGCWRVFCHCTLDRPPDMFVGQAFSANSYSLHESNTIARNPQARRSHSFFCDGEHSQLSAPYDRIQGFRNTHLACRSLLGYQAWPSVGRCAPLAGVLDLSPVLSKCLGLLILNLLCRRNR